MTFEIREHVAADGKSPYRNWFLGLPESHAVKVDIALRRIEAGNTSKEGRIPTTPPGKPNRSVNTASQETWGVAV